MQPVEPAPRRRASPVAVVILGALALVLLFGIAGWARGWLVTSGPGEPEAVGTSRPVPSWSPAVPTPAPPTAPAPSSSAPEPPESSGPPAPAEPVMMVAAGDIARCDSLHDDQTGALAATLPGIVATLGDTAYDSGTAQELQDCFGGSWGAVKDRIRFAITGNHDDRTERGKPLQDYMGAAAVRDGRTYFSEDVGGWHVVVLDSNCDVVAGGCGNGSPQAAWLRDDLAASGARCTLAMYHHPRFSSGEHGGAGSVKALWSILYEGGADLVLNGHDHDYERFEPLDAGGKSDAAHGITEIVAGMGGGELRPFKRTVAGSVARTAADYGVLQVALGDGGWSTRFVGVTDAFTDEASGTCH